MSVDLETRLRNYRDVLDAAIELDLAHDVELAETLDDEMVELSGSSTSPRRTALVVVAAAGLLVGGSLALLTDHQPSRLPAADTGSESAPGTTIPSFPGDTTISPDDPSLWNPIRVAPGTVGWYELGDGPAPVPSRLTDVQNWTPDYTASFYRCSAYTVDPDGPICTSLIGGGYVGSTTFGGTGELGTRLGDMSSADLAWTLAAGSLWGYDEMPSPPPTTPITVGDHAGVMYSNADTTYLVWEEAANVHLWIRATGWTIDEMVALAMDVRPAALPDQLPLRIVVDTVDTSGEPSEDELVIGSHPGMPPCAVIGTGSDCVSLPPVSDVAMVVGRRTGVSGPVTAVAAMFPIGSEDRLRVDLAGLDPVTIEPVVSPLGFQYSIFRAGDQRIIGSGTVSSDGSVVPRFSYSPDSTGPATTTTFPVGPSTTRDPRCIGGRYTVIDGDNLAFIAAQFDSTVEAILAANGWSDVEEAVIFPGQEIVVPSIGDPTIATPFVPYCPGAS